MTNFEWIDPAERLPKDGEEVLVTLEEGTEIGGCSICGGRDVMQAQFHNDPSFSGKWYPLFCLWDNNSTEVVQEVVAWAPLPEPYAKMPFTGEPFTGDADA